MGRVKGHRMARGQSAIPPIVACILLVCLLPAPVFAQQPLVPPPMPEQGLSGDLTPPSSSGIISVSLEAGPLQFEQDGEGREVVAMDGFQCVLTPGAPRLPVKAVEVFMPAGSRVAGLEVHDIEWSDVEGTHALATVSPEATGDDSGVTLAAFEAPASGVYPEAVAELASVVERDGLQAAVVRFYPVQYDMSTGQLRVAQRARIEVRYQNVAPLLRLDRKLKLPGLPQPAEAEMLAKAAESAVESAATAGYLIATSEGMAGSASLQRFADFKRAEGFDVRVATPRDWAGEPGRDEADQFRAFLKKYRSNWNLRYLLIVGSAAAIPMKSFYPSSTQHTGSWVTASDIYYSDLTGNWDTDGDGYPGEYSQDLGDFGAELYVGRIPFDVEAIVEDILTRAMDYQSSDGDWRRRALLAMAILDYTPSGSVQTDGAYLGSAMLSGYLDSSGFETRRMYEEDGSRSSLPHEDALERDTLAAQWVEGYGFVSWWGHGSATGAYRKLWTGGRLSSKPFVDVYHLSSFATDRPAVVFQNACFNGSPQTYSLGAQMLRYGAVATVAATAVTWYRTGWLAPRDGGSATLAYAFGQQFVANGLTVGEALAAARESHAKQYLWSPGQQQTILAFNLYGDPSLQLSPRTRKMTISLPVKQGWNLLAMPGMARALPLADALASIEGKYQAVYAYGAGADNPWRLYLPGAAAQTNTLSELRPLEGFWLFASEDCTLEVAVEAPLAASTGVALQPGWNLVGFPGQQPASPEAAFRGIADVLQGVFAFDAAGEAGWLSYHPSAPGPVNTLTSLGPGKGYWIYTTAPRTWTMP